MKDLLYLLKDLQLYHQQLLPYEHRFLFRLRLGHAVGRLPGAGFHYALSLGVEAAGRAEFIRVSALSFAGHGVLLSNDLRLNADFALPRKSCFIFFA